MVGAGLVAVAAAGCGGGAEAGGGGGGEASSPAAPSAEPSPVPGAPMDGVWQSIVDDGEIATLHVSGEEVATTGQLSCPGTLTPEADGATASVELDCDPPSEGRERGRVELDGDHLIISWEGPEWGGYIDSFTLTGEEPDPGAVGG
ncbi:hypothetical protein LG943_02315 [Streptomonospora sp. S1-112]|uniref:Uncharacterized protein n=1 Tax=Streptomonospora mangrovi TaxID=2883123 RepID=A0A9X3NHD4_9ACTN|nr:hypothetical protein [Streptomonospora mangrovi]MDA0563168.1 hypothetical protein [Streptomonospora mangrovi]